MEKRLDCRDVDVDDRITIDKCYSAVDNNSWIDCIAIDVYTSPIHMLTRSRVMCVTIIATTHI